jgi:hypothetical protein
MTITLEISDETLAVYSQYVGEGTGVPGPSTADEWSAFITQTILPNYMSEKFGVTPGEA